MSTQENSCIVFKGGTVVTLASKLPNLSTSDALVEGGRTAAVGPNRSAEGAALVLTAPHQKP